MHSRHLQCICPSHRLCLACHCVAICVLAASAFLLFVRLASVTFLVFCRKLLDRISRLMFCAITSTDSQFLHCHSCCAHGLLYSVAWCHVHFMFCIRCSAIQLLDSILASAITPHAHVSSYTLPRGWALFGVQLSRGLHTVLLLLALPLA